MKTTSLLVVCIAATAATAMPLPIPMPCTKRADSAGLLSRGYNCPSKYEKGQTPSFDERGHAVANLHVRSVQAISPQWHDEWPDSIEQPDKASTSKRSNEKSYGRNYWWNDDGKVEQPETSSAKKRNVQGRGSSY